MMKILTGYRLAMSAGAFLLLCACSGMLGSDKPPDKTFWLEPLAAGPMSQLETGQTGLVLVFDVIPGLDTDRLLTLDPDAELNRFTAARWPDHLLEFGSSLIRSSLQSTGWFSYVNDGRESMPGDCSLELETQQFYTQIDRGARAVAVQIGMSGQYHCQGVSSKLNLDSSVPVRGAGLGAIVAAHQQAFEQVMQSLLKQIEAVHGNGGTD